MRYGVAKDYLKGSRRHHRGYAHFPFDRFLTSRLGLLWDDVYAEMSAEFDKRSLVGHSFFRDLRWYVKTRCWFDETGNTYSGDFLVQDEFYVDPLTGILCWAPVKDRSRLQPEVNKIPIAEGKAYEKLDGIWYYTEFTDNPFYLSYWQTPETHRFNITKKRQLGKKELRDLRLKNNNVEFLGRCQKCGFYCTSHRRCIHAVLNQHL